MWHPLTELYPKINPEGKVLDVGCAGFVQVATSRRLGLSGLSHFGVDYSDSDDVPDGVLFRKADLNHGPIPFDDDEFDLVVASHIIEHLSQPVEFFGECVRVCKPGGVVYFEAPSERSLLIPGVPFRYDQFYSTSFFDDPTHVSRPWTPQSFYRLACYYSCEPIEAGYITSWKMRLLFPLMVAYALIRRNARLLEFVVWRALGWASYIVLKKPVGLAGSPGFRYFIPADRG